MNYEALSHVFLVSYPGQGNINPMLRAAKKLAAEGLLVTLCTARFFGEELKRAGRVADEPTPVGDGFIRFEFFEDGIEGIDSMSFDLSGFVSQLERFGKQSLGEMMRKHAEENRPVSCLIGNPFLPWVCDVAEELGIPCAILWVQSCAVFSFYYHYFHKSVPFPSESEPELDVQLPSLPLLKHDEIPSFLHPSDQYSILGFSILDQIRKLTIPFCVLMDTYEELEKEVFNHMSKLCPVKPIGPLFMNPRKLEVDMSVDWQKPDDCTEWLDSKPPRSVIYVSFGTIVYLKQEQVDEIAYGLCNSGFSFLWVLKPPPYFLGAKPHELPEGLLEKAGNRAKLVQWSSQEQVLAHPSTACFVTHCGWNSSVEAVSLGVPVVVFPQWGDQVTNAKFLVDEFGVGLRLSRGAAANRLVLREDIEKCLAEAMVGAKAEDIRENALKWKKAAKEAVAEGGPSHSNIKEFADEIRRRWASSEIKKM